MIIKVGLIGSRGKMGKAIIDEIKNFPDMELVCKIVREVREKDESSSFEEHCHQADVWIDFSSQEMAEKHITTCIKHNKPLLMCTTGSKNIDELIGKQKLTMPFMHAPNTSITFAHLRNLLKHLKSWEVCIGDIHHHSKKDSPSGTTKQIASFMENVKNVYSFRNSITGAKMLFELANNNEMISLSYTTCNRTPYAEGALKIASWLLTKKADKYEMEDFLTSL